MEDDGGKPLHSRRKPTRPSILIKIQIGFILFSLGQIGLPSSDTARGLRACLRRGCDVWSRRTKNEGFNHARLFNQDWKG